MLTNMHRGSATSCTVSVHDHARFFVHDKPAQHAPSECMFRPTNMHRSGATQDYIPTYVGYEPHQRRAFGTTEPVMHCVQDGRNSYRTELPITETYRTTNATHDRARAQETR